MKKEFICTSCPQGCELVVEDEGGNLKVTGNKCPRGEKYGLEEFRDPKRILTTTVRVEGGVLGLLPVRTRDPIPKGIIFKCMNETANIEVAAPVTMGEVILPNICDSGVDLIASREIKKP